MAGRVYALFVGIDEYTPPVRPLAGCVNDVEAMVALLRTLAGDRLVPQALLNGQATRDNVIAAFRAHLGQAGPADVAVFYYSGHGAQEVAPPEFWAMEPDHLNETLVCVDSRQPEKHDLADKELAGLVRGVAASGAHVVVVLDCCHSGSGVRAAEEPGDQVARQVGVDRRPRSLDAYDLSGLDPRALAVTREAPAAVSGSSGWTVDPGAARYVLLAACEARQLAKEQPVDGLRRGVFSVALQAALRDGGGSLSYADLISWSTTRVADLTGDQTPQLEAADPADGDRQFLGGLLDRRSHHRLTHSRRRGWIVDAGRVHGIPTSDADGATVFGIYPLGTDPVAGQAVATATVQGPVELGFSPVTVAPATQALDPDRQYQAVLRSVVWPPMTVSLAGDSVARDQLAAAIAPIPGVVVADRDHAELEVTAAAGTFTVRRVADNRLAAAPVAGADGSAATRVAELLARIARWRRLRDLAPAGDAFPPEALRLEVRGGAGTDAQAAGRQADLPTRLRLRYTDDGRPPTVRITVTNTGAERVFVAVLGLSDRYGITSLLHQTWGEWLEPGQQLAARAGRDIPLQVSDEVLSLGVDEVTDVVKVVAATEAFAARSWAQEELALTGSRAGTRGFGDEEATGPRWWTAACAITTHRPRAAVPVVGAGTDLSPTTRISAPDAVAVTARLVGAGALTRAADSHTLPPALRAGSAPVDLNPTRAITDEPDALELSWPAGGPALDPADPVIVRIAEPVAEHESVLPFAWFDGYWIPVGRTVARGADEVQVAVDRLPDTSRADLGGGADRSLGGSIRILFRKLVGRRLGLSYQWPRLALATVAPDGDVRYDVDAVPAAVAGARRVLLYVHGIIGDTEDMVAHGHRNGLTDSYDAVLAFDYENLETPIEQTARELGKRLREAGFGAADAPRLDIVAHSMGGLVSRWYIEAAGGRDVVDRLVTAGTPHGGSPWPRVQDWATAAMGVGLNGLGFSGFWPAWVLGQLAQLVERVDTALDEMVPGSDFLRRLAAADDPGIAYYLLAGDRSALDAARTGTLLGRLGLRFWRTVDALAFFNDPNDVAVTVDSARSVPSGRARAAVVHTVGCDHMTYFSSDDGVGALRAALTA